MRLTISKLADLLGADLKGDGSGTISSVGPAEAAGCEQVTFITDDKHLSKLKSSQAGAVILAKPITGLNKPQLIVKNVNSTLIEAMKIFAPVLSTPAAGIDASAKIADNVKIAPGVYIGPNVVIERGAGIGAGTVIGSGCYVGENSDIGQKSRIDSNVVIYHNCKIGNNCIIQANTTIGSTGFGYYFIDGRHQLIPHNGGVIIEDFVEIGANCCIDRAKFGNTVIGSGTKIDNLVQIAHNVIIGKCCIILSQVAIAGSCKIGDGVVFGGQVGIADNVEIGEGAMIGGQSGVMSDIPAGQKVLGSPPTELKQALKIMSIVRRLPELLKQLDERVKNLESSKDIKK